MVRILFAKVWGLATSCSHTRSWKSALLGHVAHQNLGVSIVIMFTLIAGCFTVYRVYNAVYNGQSHLQMDIYNIYKWMVPWGYLYDEPETPRHVFCARVYDDGSVLLEHTGLEVGQGMDTKALQALTMGLRKIAVSWPKMWPKGGRKESKGVTKDPLLEVER